MRVTTYGFIEKEEKLSQIIVKYSVLSRALYTKNSTNLRKKSFKCCFHSIHDDNRSLWIVDKIQASTGLVLFLGVVG